VTALLAALLALAAADPLACPPGTSHAGEPPPEGSEEWCERADPAGKPRRHGPARAYYDGGAVRTESTWRDGQLHGPFTEYHRDGKPAARGAYRDGEKDGPWVVFYEGGQKEEEVSFDRGVKSGRFVSWWRQGKKRTEGRFCAGLQCGRWASWSEDGAELGTVVYEELRSAP
jgi:antitoxin component YwqK of YwqJK toxin-antitoxin module